VSLKANTSVVFLSKVELQAIRRASAKMHLEMPDVKAGRREFAPFIEKMFASGCFVLNEVALDLAIGKLKEIKTSREHAVLFLTRAELVQLDLAISDNMITTSLECGTGEAPASLKYYREYVALNAALSKITDALAKTYTDASIGSGPREAERQ
jgi:hypothetical protein